MSKGTYCLYIQGALKTQAGRSCRAFVNTYHVTQRYVSESGNSIVISVRTSKLSIFVTCPHAHLVYSVLHVIVERK